MCVLCLGAIMCVLCLGASMCVLCLGAHINNAFDTKANSFKGSWLSISESFNIMVIYHTLKLASLKECRFIWFS